MTNTENMIEGGNEVEAKVSGEAKSAASSPATVKPFRPWKSLAGMKRSRVWKKEIAPLFSKQNQERMVQEILEHLAPNVVRLPLHSYRYNGEPAETRLGFSAQEVLEAGHDDFVFTDSNGTLMVDYGGLGKGAPSIPRTASDPATGPRPMTLERMQFFIDGVLNSDATEDEKRGYLEAVIAGANAANNAAIKNLAQDALDTMKGRQFWIDRLAKANALRLELHVRLAQAENTINACNSMLDQLREMPKPNGHIKD